MGVTGTHRHGTIAVVLVLASVLGTASLASEEHPYPGKTYQLPGSQWSVFIPDGIEILRGATVAFEERLHDETHMAAINGFACIWVGTNSGGGFANWDPKSRTVMQSYFDEVAEATGHPELAWSPFVSYGNSRNTMRPVELANLFPERAIAVHCGLQLGEGGGLNGRLAGKDIPVLSVEEEDPGGKTTYIDRLADAHSGDRAQGFLVTYVPMWGWPHGFYSIGDFYWPWMHDVINMRLPENMDLSKGPVTLRKIPLDNAWVGDPGTWKGLWPKIYPYSEKGSNNRTSWLPNEECAWLWRAYVSSHPTETQQQQGIMHAGDAATNYLMHGQANFIVKSPTTPYNIKNVLGKNYPVTRQGTTIRVQAGNYGVASYDPGKVGTITFYDGMHRVGEAKPNFYGVYTLSVQMDYVGIRRLSAQLEMTDGSMVTTRPALIHVHGDATFVEHAGVTTVATAADQTMTRGLRVSPGSEPGIDPIGLYSIAGRKVFQHAGDGATAFTVRPGSLMLPAMVCTGYSRP